jgi:hypothetical protein
MDQLSKLKQWLKIKDDIKLFERPQRGLYSTKNIKKFDQIIKIKSRHLMEYSTIYKMYPIDNIEEKNSLVAFYVLKIYLENIENTKNLETSLNKELKWWYPYIDSLPNDVSEYLYYWPSSKLKLLNNTSIMSNGFYNYNDHIESIENDWNTIYDFIEKNDLLNSYTYDYLHDLFIKFRILVGSRIFGYKKYGIDESGMVPYIDMINHSFTSNTTWYFDDSQDCFILQANCDILKGTEIVDDYGDKSNINLLLFYGFTLKDNPFPILRIDLSNPIDDDSIFFELTLEFCLDNINSVQKNMLKNKLNEIKNHHEKQLKIFNLNKCNCHYVANITNIYLDEINLINHLISCIKTN